MLCVHLHPESPMHRHLLTGVIAAVALSSAPTLAQDTFRWQDTSAMPRGPYLGLQGGASFLEDNRFNGGGADSKTKYDPGPAGLLTLGYGFGFGLRLELEGGYRRN